VALECFDRYKTDFSPRILMILSLAIHRAYHRAFSPRPALGKPGTQAATQRLEAEAPQPRFAISDELLWVMLRRLWLQLSSKSTLILCPDGVLVRHSSKS
jgi:hypothetical protein